MSQQLAVITAKTDQTGQSTATLSLVQHARDAAAVAGWLFDRWLADTVRENIDQACDGRGRTFVQWAAAVHDTGKATPAFQNILAAYNDDRFGVRARLEAAGFDFPPGAGRLKHPRHCQMGNGIVFRWLGQRYGAEPRIRHTVASIIGAHHGVPQGAAPDMGTRDDWAVIRAEDHPRNEAWVAAQDEFLNLMTAELGADAVLQKLMERGLPVSVQLQVAGVVVVADWLASDSNRFPYVENEPMNVRLEAAELAADLPPAWTAQLPQSIHDLLRARFDLGPDAVMNPGQEAVLEVATTVESPPLIILEAPTGSGKTEAALMAAEVLAARFGCGGLEFLLPTRGTADGVFDRLTPWITRLPGAGLQSVSLAHGKAHLNQNFAELVRRSRYSSVGVDDVGHLGKVVSRRGSGADAVASAYVSGWLSGRRKNVLASMVAGTIDQLLLAALATRHVGLRHLGLAGKVVVIDECHSVDEYMLTYLKRALEWLAAHRVPVIAMSATLPHDIRAGLVNAYSGHVLEPPAPAEVRVTAADAAGVSTQAYPANPGRELHVTFLGSDEETLLREAEQACAAGACVAVIRNTVQDAQDTFTELRNRLGDERVTLLHSRFLAVHRAAREAWLRTVFGPKAGADRPRGLVVVATQVLEVSLDIDVDLMMSDIAPMDTLIQRAGRLHRHRRGEGESERPEGYRTAQLKLTGVSRPTVAAVPEFDSGSKAVYGAYRLLAATCVLTQHVGPIRTSDVPHLVEQAYAQDLTLPEQWQEAVAAARREYVQDASGQRLEAEAFLVPSPTTLRSLDALLRVQASEPSTETQAAARVRNTDESVEVVVVHEDGYLAHPLPETFPAGVDEDIPIELDAPTHQQAMALARCTVHLPPSLTRYALDSVLGELESLGSRYTGWQSSPLLQGQLVLPLDGNNEVVILGARLRYEYDVGLVLEPDVGEVKS